MGLKRKLDLSRFKKTMQGLTEFAVLIEQATPKQRQKLLKESSAQDPDFIALVLRKVVYFEELIFLDELVLAEILSCTTPKVLAHALYDAPADLAKVFHRQLGFRTQKLLRDELENIPNSISSQLVLGAQRQILKIARNLEAQGKLVFEIHNCPRHLGLEKSSA